MKNILKKVLSVAAATALLMTSVISASAAGEGHEHGGGNKITDSTGCDYTITLTHPENAKFEKEDTDSGITGSHYGAYQIFSGTVKGTPEYTNPGTSDPEIHIPITDIKWGNAFGILGTGDVSSEDDIHENILGFVYALSQAKTGDYSYAFGDFDGFEDLFTSPGVLNSDYYINPTPQVSVTLDSNNRVNGIVNDDNVNYDKLAVHIADVLVEPTHIDNHEWLQAFNDILGGYGQGEYGNYKNPGYVICYYEGDINSADDTKYQIKVPAGYYMIRDLSGFEDEESKSYSARLLFVADNVNQVLKESVPELDKHIVRDDDALYETEAAGVGDEVKFQLHGTLPSNYNLYLGGYQYIFTDELSDGLTLKELSSNTYVTVTVKNVYNADGTPVEDSGKIYTIYKATSYKNDGTHIAHATISAAYEEKYDDRTNTLTVSFPCLKEIEITDDTNKYYLGADSEIYVDYTAVVNEKAIVSPANGNKNTAKLTYSDNPQSYADTDDTTPDNATVYTFGLDIVKVDAAQFLKNDGNTSADDVSLSGAEFILARPVATKLGGDGNPNADTEWELATFTFIDAATASTMTPPPAVLSFTEHGYYSIVSWTPIADKTGAAFDPSWVTSTTVATGTMQGNAIKSGTGGYLNISGLNDGVTYTIAETKAPDDDYAKINPFTITLEAAKSGDEYTGKLSGATSDEDTTGSFSFDKPVDITDTFDATEDGSASMLVANFKYTDLPSTGGIGVYIYYIAGGCVVALALVLFALSKKKKTTK